MLILYEEETSNGGNKKRHSMPQKVRVPDAPVVWSTTIRPSIHPFHRYGRTRTVKERKKKKGQNANHRFPPKA